MPEQIAAALLALAGLVFLARGTTKWRRRHFVAGTLYGAGALVLVLLAAVAVLVGPSILTYHRLTHEQPVADLQFSRIAEQRFAVTLTYPTGATQRMDLAGDEWQIDARVLKWRAFVNVVGFDSAYRLERLSGRYRDIESEKNAPRTVYALNAPSRIDLWDLVRRYRERLPWVDAVYGSATYLPMADGARYEVRMAQSGLIARPQNDEARRAIGQWR